MSVWLKAAYEDLLPSDKTDTTDKTCTDSLSRIKDHNPRSILSVLSVLSEGVEDVPVEKEPPVDLRPKTDAELYIDALRAIGPCGYGPIAIYLGWGATRASQAETASRLAGRVAYDQFGRGRFVEIDTLF